MVANQFHLFNVFVIINMLSPTNIINYHYSPLNTIIINHHLNQPSLQSLFIANN